MDLGPTTLVVVDDDRPVTLRVPITNGKFTYTPLAGATQGPVSTYGPGRMGTLELAPRPSPRPALLRAAGRPAAGARPYCGRAAPPPAMMPGVAPAAPPPRPRLRRASRSASAARACAGASSRSALRLPGRERSRSRRLRRSAAAARVLGTLRKSAPAAGAAHAEKLKLKRKSPARLRLAISFTPRGGAKQTRRVTVKRR